ncbi:hypothetical protein, partial [Janthinobacterium sp. LB3P118]|uniref:hypothetical protein n=1 Tax=Janthinobacterium sp. LB3P118 TaxID=3424195 RepID=UPI003F25837B
DARQALTLAQCGELGDEGFPLGWLHGRLPFVCYVPSDSRTPGKFSEFPYLSGTEPLILNAPVPRREMI